MTKHLKANTTTSTKKSKNLKTHVHVVLDRSGSMASCRQPTIDGFNEYMNTLRSDENGKYFVTLTQFDTDSNGACVEDTFTDVPLKKVKELTLENFVPRGMTPLHDSIGRSIQASASRLERKRGANAVVMIVMTDGGENSSEEFNGHSIKALIDDKEKEGWTVTYMGANQDANAVGGNLGFKAGKTMTYSTNDMGAAFKGLASNTMARSAMYSRTLDSMAVGATESDMTVAFAATAESTDFFVEDDDANAE